MDFPPYLGRTPNRLNSSLPGQSSMQAMDRMKRLAGRRSVRSPHSIVTHRPSQPFQLQQALARTAIAIGAPLIADAGQRRHVGLRARVRLRLRAAAATRSN